MDSFSVLLIVIGAVLVVRIAADCIVKAVRSSYTDAEASMYEAKARAREASWKALEAQQLAKAEKWKYRQQELDREDGPGNTGASADSDAEAAVASS